MEKRNIKGGQNKRFSEWGKGIKLRRKSLYRGVESED
jgi:hypothetical protein